MQFKDLLKNMLFILWFTMNIPRMLKQQLHERNNSKNGIASGNWI